MTAAQAAVEASKGFLDIVIGLLEVANAIAQLALDAAKGVVQAVAALVTFGLDLLKGRLISTYHMPFHISNRSEFAGFLAYGMLKSIGSSSSIPSKVP